MIKSTFAAGIDVGSITTKCAILKDGQLLAHRLIFSGYALDTAAASVLDRLVQELGLSAESIDMVVSTGYGRRKVSRSDRDVTEITCHAKGAHFLEPTVRTVIDIGGQDCKAISVSRSGTVDDFIMNDKCAAGTGRFLEVMARALELDLNDFGQIAGMADEPASISSTCAVFAESEIISLIAGGTSRENIVAGLHRAIAERVVSMAGRISIEPPIMLTGGVAKNEGVIRALEETLQEHLLVSPLAQITGALGAAILASRTTA